MYVTSLKTCKTTNDNAKASRIADGEAILSQVNFDDNYGYVRELELVVA